MFYTSMLQQYYTVLGAFENNLFDTSSVGEILATTFFFLTTFLSQITILNMLIAIMGDTYSHHAEEQVVQSKRQKLRLLSEYIDIVEFYQNKLCPCFKKETRQDFVVVVQSAYDEEDEEGNGDD